MIEPFQLSHFTAVSCLGYGLKAHVDALNNLQTGLKPCDFPGANLNTFIGKVPDIESLSLPSQYADRHSRNNLLAFAALKQDGMMNAIEKAKVQYGKERIAVLYATTTSGFTEAEKAYRNRDANGALPADFNYHKTAHPFATCEFLRQYLDLKGPAMTLATACSSSAKIFIQAHHLLSLDLCDAVLLAGVDSLCLNTLYGFNSLGILSDELCKPFDKDRKGLSLGEAAAFVLLERKQDAEIGLLGFGESTDGYHMSSPHPEGEGAKQSMRQALQSSGLSAEDIDYINCHGTSSVQNDISESLAVDSIFHGQPTMVSSTKGSTGHTLGAAGALETVIACLAIQENTAWGMSNSKIIDPTIPANIILNNEQRPIRNVLSNSFGFGGNNASLIVGALNP